MSLYLVRAALKPGVDDEFEAWLNNPEALTPGFQTTLHAAIRAGHSSGRRLYFTVPSPTRRDPRAEVEETLGKWLEVKESIPVRESVHGDNEGYEDESWDEKDD
jgi:hypothetical protein